MGFIDFIKNTLFENDDEMINIVPIKHLQKKCNTTHENKNIPKVHHSQTFIKPTKKIYTTTYSQNFKPKISNPTKKTNYKENIKKGQDYEKYVGQYIESFGYKVDYRGLTMGRKDGGIDLIAHKNNTYVLIQCKNWTKKRVTQKDIRVFVGDYYTYLEEHPYLKDKKTKAYFYVSNDLYDKGAYNYQEDKKFLELKVLKIESLRNAILKS